MTKQVSRRAMLSLAAVPVAMPSLALAAAAPDPVFAAIERHRIAYEAFEAICTEREDFEDTLPKEVLRAARVRIGSVHTHTGECEPLYVYSRKEIDERLEPHGPYHPPGWIEERKQRYYADLDADAAQLKEAQDAAGLTAMEERWYAADTEEEEAERALLRTVPATLEGTKALASYMTAHLKIQRVPRERDCPEFVLLATITAVLAAMPDGRA